MKFITELNVNMRHTINFFQLYFIYVNLPKYIHLKKYMIIDTFLKLLLEIDKKLLFKQPEIDE